jgi:hypothetical protein
MFIEKDKGIENKSKGNEISCYCNQCKNDIKHIVLQDYYEQNSEIVDTYSNTKSQSVCNSIYWSTDHQIIKCVGCNTISYRAEKWFSEYQDDENSGFYYDYFPEPKRNKLTVDVKNLPELIDSLYLESINAFNNKYYLLCAAGLRIVIESVCENKNIKNGTVNKNGKNLKKNNLEGKINGLHEHGCITESQSLILHKLRDIGNNAVHEFYAPPKNILTSAFNVIEILLKTIYELPKEVEKMTGRNL